MTSKYRCSLISSEVEDENGSPRTTYGISMADLTDPAWEPLEIRDITLDRPALLELIRLCNRLELSPEHLWDVVEDFLGRD